MPFSATHRVAGPGRPKGLKNKKTLLTEAFLNATVPVVVVTNKTPLELLIEWANDIRLDYATRIQCAEILMPYSHRRKPVEIESKHTESVAHGITVQFVGEQRRTYDMLPDEEPPSP